MSSMLKTLLGMTALVLAAPPLHAEVSLPSVFGTGMVLQREIGNPVWGQAQAHEAIVVSIDGQTHRTTADDQGRWRLLLTPMKAGGPHRLEIAGTNAVVFEDVLIGEVWVCAGQSNMEWSVDRSDHADVEVASANFPEIRMITVPRVGTDTPQADFDGQWSACTPESVKKFSAAGYFFGRRLHHTLGVPVGLIDVAWGGSRIEAWLPRDVMEADGSYDALLTDWDRRLAEYPPEAHATRAAEYRAWLDAGKPGKRVNRPRDPRTGNARPGNIFNGVVNPILGYGIRGMVWYQGESNAGRAYQYRRLFPKLIGTLRELWGQGDFSFYWVQLADYQAQVDQPTGGGWAELREAQTQALSLPNTGEAVAIDLGEGRDVHPRDKQTVAARLVRHALAKNYGFDMAADSPRFASMKISKRVATLTFDSVASKLYAHDVDEVRGFAIAGKDKKFVWAQAKIVSRRTVEVWSDEIARPAAVRYGWESNPVVNLYDRNGLPVTPFRTDEWPGVTEGQETVDRM